MTKDFRTTEGLRRIKLSIDRQMNGDIPAVFGVPCNVHMEHGTVADDDGSLYWVPLAITTGGRFAVLSDGSTIPAEVPLQ